MTSNNTPHSIGIEDARKKLGDLVTAAVQGADIVLTRNGRPVAQIVPYQEPRTVTINDLARDFGHGATPERVARFVGAYSIHDPRTGQLPQPWNGKGLAASFTEAEAAQLSAEWSRAWLATDGFTDLIDGTEPIEQMPNQWRA